MRTRVMSSDSLSVIRIALDSESRSSVARASFLCLLFASLFLLTGCATTTRKPDLVYFPPPPSEPRIIHLASFDSIADLAPARVGFIDSMLGGSPSPHVDTPAGLAYVDGHLFISDTGLNVVHDWNLNTGQSRRVGASGDVELRKPVAVAVDDAKWLYVADTSRGEVVAFNSEGRVKFRCKPSDREGYRPCSIALSGNMLYTTDLTSHQVDAFSTNNGEHAGASGGIGSGPGKFYFPSGVTGLEPSANAAPGYAVADMMNSRVQLFDVCNKFLSSFGQPGDRYGDLGKPKHLAVGPDGSIFVVDAEFGVVHVFNQQGQLLMVFGGPENKPGGTPLPFGIAIARDNPPALAKLVPPDFAPAYFVFVSNTVGNRRLSVFAVGRRTDTPK